MPPRWPPRRERSRVPGASPSLVRLHFPGRARSTRRLKRQRWRTFRIVQEVIRGIRRRARGTPHRVHGTPRKIRGTLSGRTTNRFHSGLGMARVKPRHFFRAHPMHASERNCLKTRCDFRHLLLPRWFLGRGTQRTDLTKAPKAVQRKGRTLRHDSRCD